MRFVCGLVGAVLAHTVVLASGDRLIEEVVVTATKREASVRDLPASIDAFSGDELEARGATTMEEILRFSPGVVMNPNYNPDGNKVAIRGVNTNPGVDLYTSPTGIYYDEVLLVNPSLYGITPDIDPFDLQAVEVLKGPQGTLLGGSSLAGALRYVPNKPDFEASYGSLGTGTSALSHSGSLAWRSTLMGNLTLPGQLALRAAASKRGTAGTIDDLTRGRLDIDRNAQQQLRVLGHWQPVSRLHLQASWFERQSSSRGGVVADNVHDRATRVRRLDDTSESTVSVKEARLAWDFDALGLTIIGNDLDKRGGNFTDSSALLGLPEPATAWVQTDIPARQRTLELRAVSSRPTSGHPVLSGWNYVAGYFHMRSDQLFGVQIYSDPLGGSSAESPTAMQAISSTTRALAVEDAIFVDASRMLPGGVELTAGARAFEQLTTGGTDGDVGRAHEKGINPKLAVSVDLGEQIRLHVSAVKGFRFGGFNNPVSPDIPPQFDSDQLWNYELGLRTDWLGGALQADLTAFWIDWRGLQIQQSSSVSFSAYVDNVGGAQNKGVEFAVVAALPGRIRLTANGAYLDARITTQFDSADGPVPAGTRLPASPRTSGSVRLDHARVQGAWQLVAGLSLTHVGGMRNDLFNTYPLSGYNQWGLNFSASAPSFALRPRISLSVTNLTDEQALASILTNNAFTLVSSFIAPRVVNLNLELNF